MLSTRAILATCAAAAVLVIGGGIATAMVLTSGNTPDPGHSRLTAKGSVSTSKFHYGLKPPGCYADASQPLIKQDATVTIRDQRGEIVAAGPLAAGVVPKDKTGPCEFDFRIEGVPTGSKFFTIAVGTGAPVTVSSDVLFSYAAITQN